MAEKVVNTEQIFKGNTLGVKRMDTVEKKENVENLRNTESSRESTTVTVFGLPEGSTKDSVHIHFQKRKNGGGDIHKVEMLGEGKAMIIFEDPKGRFHCGSYLLLRRMNAYRSVLCLVAKTVVNTQQIFKGKVLEVKHLDTEMATENVEKLTNSESSGEKESTVIVSGLPKGCTENSVHIHFQKRKNGGGDIHKVEMLGEGKARVTFEDPEGRFYCISYLLL